LYAKAIVTTEADINKQPGAVKLQFQHLLSKVKFTFKSEFPSERQTIKVKDIKMTAAKAGSIDLAVADHTKGWVLTDAQETYSFGDLENTLTINDINGWECAQERLLIPAAADYVYTITFTVELYNGQNLAQTFNETTELTGKALEMGTAYNFVATLSPANLGLYPIQFTVGVDSWVEDSVDVDPTTDVVANDAELKAAMAKAAVETIKMKAGNYTLESYRAGVALVGAEDGVVVNVENKKFGVNGDVNIENVKLVFANANYCGFQHTNIEVYKNCTIVGQPFLYGADVTFDGCTFEQTSADAYNVWTYGAKNVKFNNCVFNSAGKAVLVYSESKTLVQNVLFEGCTLNASAPATGKAAIEVDSSLIKEYTININTTTANGFDAGSVSNNTLYNQKKGTNANIFVNGVKVEVAGHASVEEASTSVDLIAALVASNSAATPSYVAMSSDVQIDKVQLTSNGYGSTGITVNGGTLDGQGHVLDIAGAGGTWDSGINVTGGTIKNITVTGSFRGIFIREGDKKVVLENVTTTGTTYTISCDKASGQGLEVYNSKFYGWTSYAGTIGTAYFENCLFGEGSGYAYCRPYAPTEFVNCAFEAGFRLDARATVTFENCTIGGVALTAENLSTLVTNSSIAKATVK
ncbi:MAG: fimbrillin family protein, partial [Tidjanibacter sp.]|nr:fimbrillin family protein [Tidjanibacter sp.]